VYFDPISPLNLALLPVFSQSILLTRGAFLNVNDLGAAPNLTD